MAEEKWKDISGFEGLYSISSDGRVWSYYTEKILAPIQTKRGYLRVHLARNGNVYTKSIHRLVAEAFIDNLDGKPTVNHINEVKTDNRADNLEWATQREQNIHGTRIERTRKHTDYQSRNIDYVSVAAKHDYRNMNKNQMKSVLQFDKNGLFIAQFDGVSEAARQNGISAGHICCCLKGRRKTCGGYQWKYA